MDTMDTFLDTSLSDEGKQRFITEVFDLFIRPEIEKRQREGKLPVPFQPAQAQVLMAMSGLEVRLNEECRIELTDTKITYPEEDDDKNQIILIWPSPTQVICAYKLLPFYPRENLEETLRQALKSEYKQSQGSYKDLNPDLEDSIQDKFLKAIRVLHRYHLDIEHPTTYLRRTVDKKEEIKEAPFDRDKDVDQITPKIQRLADDALFIAELKEAIKNLPDKQEEIINLVYVQGYSLAEASRLLGITEPSVKERRDNAIIALKKKLNPKEFSK